MKNTQIMENGKTACSLKIKYVKNPTDLHSQYENEQTKKNPQACMHVCKHARTHTQIKHHHEEGNNAQII